MKYDTPLVYLCQWGFGPSARGRYWYGVQSQVPGPASGEALTRRRIHMSETPHQHGYLHRKDDYVRRLRRIEGQARGLQRMVEEEKYCIDILTQIAAMTKALHAVSLGLLEEHMNHCVVDAARAGDREAQEKVREATDAIARLVR